MATQAASIPNELCPWCDSVITHQKFLDVERRIREQERSRLDEQHVKLEEEFNLHREADARVAEERASVRAAERIAQVSRERDQAVQQAADVQKQEHEAKERAPVQAVARPQPGGKPKRDPPLRERLAEATGTQRP